MLGSITLLVGLIFPPTAEPLPSPAPQKMTSLSLSLAPKAYKGKFSYKDNAKDENIYVSLAAGLVDKGPAHIFSTWTKSYRGYEKAPLVSIGHIAFDETDTDSFIVFDGYYTWKGKVLDGGDKIVLGIWYGDEKEARSETTIQLVNSEPSSGN